MMIEIVLEIPKRQDDKSVAFPHVLRVQYSMSELRCDAIQVCCLVLLDSVEMDERAWHRGSHESADGITFRKLERIVINCHVLRVLLGRRQCHSTLNVNARALKSPEI